MGTVICKLILYRFFGKKWPQNMLYIQLYRKLLDEIFIKIAILGPFWNPSSIFDCDIF